MTTENTTGRYTPRTDLTQEEIDEITIEATVKVYLNWDGENQRWIVAPSTMNGNPLDADTDQDSVDNVYTDFGGYDDMPAQKRNEWNIASRRGMPTGPELIAILQEYQPPLW